MGNEIELKLRIAPADVQRLLRHPLLKACTRRTLRAQQLVSVYYDTPTFDLNQHRVAVRLRRVGRRWIQTVKTEGTVAAGLHDRPEWESEAREHTLDFQTIPDVKLRKFLSDETVHHALRPVFTTTFTRARRFLELPSGDTVEFALDRGDIRADGEQVPICEVELELKSGDPARLFAFALGLQDTVPLRLANASKAERGYRLARREPMAPVKAKPPDLEKNLPVHAAFAHIVQNCLGQIQANEEGILDTDDPEFVHQMRVAVRRMRAALRLFSPLVPKEQTAARQEELRWLAGELNGARNWDVFTQETLPPIILAFPDHQGLAWLRTVSVERCRRSRARAREAVASARYQQFLFALGVWLCAPPWHDLSNNADADSTTAIPLPTFAGAILQKRHKQLKKRGAQIAALAPPERHAVRIAAKKLRYTAEFFSALYPAKLAREYVAALAALQDVLGALNDAATAVVLLQEIAVEEQASARQSRQDLILGWESGTAHAKLKEWKKAWKQFVQQKTFW